MWVVWSFLFFFAVSRSEKVAPVALDDIGKVMRHRHHADRHSSEFVKLIHDILNPPNDEEGKIPIIRYT